MSQECLKVVFNESGVGKDSIRCDRVGCRCGSTSQLWLNVRFDESGVDECEFQ